MNNSPKKISKSIKVKTNLKAGTRGISMPTLRRPGTSGVFDELENLVE